MKRLALRLGNLEFRPHLGWGIAAAAFIALTVALGNWQLRRAAEKTEAAQRADDLLRRPVLEVRGGGLAAADYDQRRVRVSGRFVAASTFFLDNRTMRGAVGYEVVTPLTTGSGSTQVLVNRGWIAATGDRGVLPEVPTTESVQTIEGIAVTPGKAFVELGPDDGQGVVRQNLVIEREQRRLAAVLQPFVIQQTSPANDGLLRVWARRDSGADRNKAYALQWYSMATLGAFLFCLLNTKRLVSGGH